MTAIVLKKKALPVKGRAPVKFYREGPQRWGIPRKTRDVKGAGSTKPGLR
jgi:hypothetical protein